MCVVCGCHATQDGETPSPGEERQTSVPAIDARTGDLHYGQGAGGAHVPGLDPLRAVKLEADVLGENARLAALNRAHFEAHGVKAFDLVSSPGSGKTTLLVATIDELARCAPRLPVAVIEGDQQTSLDADRIRDTGVDAIQVNTGKGCHLDARMVGDAFARLHLHAGRHSMDERAGTETSPSADMAGTGALLLIENVGNLVCPALWDLGEAAKIVVLSVTEGDDKPLKYPDMFAAATLMVINKIDLLPHVDFDVERCIASARRINPSIEVLCLSATRGEGLTEWAHWLLQRQQTNAAETARLPQTGQAHAHASVTADHAG